MRHIFTSHFLKTTVMESVLFPGGLIWVIYSTVKKRELFPGVFEGKKDIVAKILVFVAFVMVIVSGLVPKYKDIPYFNNNEFCYMEGVAQNYSDRAAKNAHHVRIKDEESGEEIRVHFGYKSTIKQGDQLKVKYLPNSKEALLLELNGKEVDAVIF